LYQTVILLKKERYMNILYMDIFVYNYTFIYVYIYNKYKKYKNIKNFLPSSCFYIMVTM